jgi:addiction module HigA family antidote
MTIMADYAAKRPTRCPTHPGAVLRDTTLPALQLSKTAFAQMLGISRQHLYDILNGVKPISPEVAVRLGKLLGNGPGLWVRMQAAYDTWQAEQTVDVSKIKTLKAA